VLAPNFKLPTKEFGTLAHAMQSKMPVAMPAHCLLGPENEGWKVGMATLTNERGHIGASTISLQRRLDSMAALGGDLDAVHRDELAALVARGRTYLALAQRQGPVASVAACIGGA